MQESPDIYNITIDKPDGFGIRLYRRRAYLGNALVSIMMSNEQRHGFLTMFRVRHSERGNGYGKLLLAHWLVESEARGCDVASADFVNQRAMRTFRSVVDSDPSVNMYGVENDVTQPIATYDDAERGLGAVGLMSSGAFESVSCDVDLRNSAIMAAARLILHPNDPIV